MQRGTPSPEALQFPYISLRKHLSERQDVKIPSPFQQESPTLFPGPIDELELLIPAQVSGLMRYLHFVLLLDPIWVKLGYGLL